MIRHHFWRYESPRCVRAVRAVSALCPHCYWCLMPYNH